MTLKPARKAQTEIMGLVVIVILFIFIGLIYLMFSGDEGEDPNVLIRESTAVQNLIGAYAKITPCSEIMPPMPMEKIISECYGNPNLEFCGKPCQDTIKDVMAETVASYSPNVTYAFEVYDLDNKTFVSSGTCSKKEPGNVGKKYVTSGKVRLEAWLKICRKAAFKR